MNLSNAWQIINSHWLISVPTPEDDFKYVESLKYVYDKTGNNLMLYELGKHYFQNQNYDLALMYFERSDYGNRYLGDIWYYGLTGSRNYKKAYGYYAHSNDDKATYMQALMFKYGHYVIKNPMVYKQVIEKLYPKVADTDLWVRPFPEVALELADLRMVVGKYKESISLYVKAKDFLANRIKDFPDKENFFLMKRLVNILGNAWPVEQRDGTIFKPFDIYDLYHYFKKPHLVIATYNDTQYSIEAVPETCYQSGFMAVHFSCEECGLDNWYLSTDEFLKKATIDGKRITSLYNQIRLWREK